MMAVLKNYRLNCQDSFNCYCIADFIFCIMKMFLFFSPGLRRSLEGLRAVLSLVQVGYAMLVFQAFHK